MSSELEPPKKTHELEDSGTHDMDSSDSSDDFVDASENPRAPLRSGDASPIPITRVEKVDESPSYGEVPGTTAYHLRTADAVPDEIEVVPEGKRSRSASRASRPSTPGGTRVPRMVVEKIDPDAPSYGDVPGTAAYNLRKADAEPDEIIKSPQSASAPANPFKGQASPTARNDRFELSHDEQSDDPGGGDDEEGFGDDFDDFEEGQEADDDFGEFDEGFRSSSAAEELSSDGPTFSQSPPQPSIPILNFRDLDDLESIQSACGPYLHALFPSYPPTTSSELPTPNQQIFLSERSISLYTQLIAPPPLAPPNWLRSRIRRLFLVSLGVPVDLDEILPASKQKKLILPSIRLKSPDTSHSPRPSTDATVEGKAANGQLGKIKAAHDSSASVSSTASGKRRRKGKEVEALPEWDIAAARRLANTTAERIDGMSDEELKKHVDECTRISEKGREFLGYWERRVEEAGREKEAFEGVIENLIGFARKVRK